MSQAAYPRIVKLWERDPRCNWCHRITLKPFKMYGGNPCKLYPTLDHIITRRMGNGHRGRAVLSCYGCNSDRNKQEQLILARTPRRTRGHRGGWAVTLWLIAHTENPCQGLFFSNKYNEPLLLSD